jgi:SAM-dependent methyltransferase
MIPSRLLDQSFVWFSLRYGLELAIGLYGKRVAWLRQRGVLEGSPSVIDLGCGIGQYAGITEGRYLGIDLNRRYIDHASRGNRRPNATFRCVDAAALLDERTRCDLALMVDFVHHIPDELAVNLLRTMALLADRFVVNFEPVTEQVNRLGRW